MAANLPLNKGSKTERYKNFTSNLLSKYILCKYILYIGLLLLIPLGIFTRGFGLDMIILTFWLIATILFKNGTQFIKDWFKYIILFWLYETSRGFADNIATFLHRPLIIDLPIKLDILIFGFISKGQNLNYFLRTLLPPNAMPKYFLVFLFFFYTMFFWYWAGAGFFLWLKDKKLFHEYMKNLLILSFMSSIIYALFPTAPPWYASSQGILPPLNRIMWSNVFPNSGISYIHFWDQNYFAALPSLHFGWPLLASIYLIKYAYQNSVKHKQVYYAFLLVPFIILFAIVYGAEHYVVDAVASVIIITAILISTSFKN